MIVRAGVRGGGSPPTKKNRGEAVSHFDEEFEYDPLSATSCAAERSPVAARGEVDTVSLPTT